MSRFLSRRAAILAAAVGAALSLPNTASAAVIEVNSFLPGPVPVVPVADAWYQSDVRPGGTASIVSLAGMGGNLENNQPIPVGAALLTTDFTNAAKAEVGTFKDFGAASLLQNLSLSYSHYNGAQAGQNLFAAPSLKLSIFAPGGTGDNFGQLVYEPNWNRGAGSQQISRDGWITENITPSTGAGGDSTGGWWWTGGFEIPSGAGGPPLRSLAEWFTAFSASDPTDFANARITGLSVGVGTFNQGQIGYFDAVTYQIGTSEAVTYNFEPPSQTGGQVPEPASLAVFGLIGGVSALAYRKRRKATA